MTASRRFPFLLAALGLCGCSLPEHEARRTQDLAEPAAGLTELRCSTHNGALMQRWLFRRRSKQFDALWRRWMRRQIGGPVILRPTLFLSILHALEQRC